MRQHNRPFYLSVCGSTIAALFQGLGLVFGPIKWRSSPSYAVLRTQMPMRWWGAVFLIVAALMGYGVMRDWHAVRIGAALGLSVVTLWCVCFIIAAFTGQLAGVPASWFAWAVFLYVQTIGPKGGFARMMRDGTS